MKIKTKLMTAIMSFVLVLGLLSVGVYALNQAEVTLGGNLTFSAYGVYAEVTGSVQGAVLAEGEDGIYTPLLFSADNTPNQDSWEKDFGFNADGTDIVITINIQNLATDRPLYAMISDTITEEVENVIKTVKLGEEDCLGKCIEVPQSTTKTIVVTMELDNVNLSLDGATYGYKIELNKDEIEEEVEETYYTVAQWQDTSVVGEGNALNFTIADGEATVSMLNATDTAGDIVVPSYVYESEGGTPIPVTTVGCFGYGTEAVAAPITSIILPNTIKTLDNSFICCNTLETIYIPNSVTEIISAFDECTSFEKIIIEDINRYVEIVCRGWSASPFSSSPNAYLYYSDNLDEPITNIVLTNATKIEGNVFWGYPHLESITIPDSVETICDYAFDSCTNLKTINFTGTTAEWEAVTKGNYAIPEGVTVVCSDSE